MFAALSRRPPPLAARPAQRISRARSTPFASAASAPPSGSGTMAGKKCKEIREILQAPPRHWVGNGFHVFPVFHNRAFTKELSPWLMFDYAAPKEFSPSYERRGVGQHPHRGFETITIAFNGEVEHGDSMGNRDTIVFVRRGAITVGEEAKPVNPQGVALMHLGGDVLRLSATEADTEVLLLAGEPIDEPIAARGPFVMNTHEEIMQANKDFMNGRMGQ